MRTTVHDVGELRELVGRDLGTSDWLEVTQDRVDAFAATVDDRHWVHNDPARALRGPFGGPIAHAHLTLSLVVSLLTQVLVVGHEGALMFYGYNRARFPAPVPVGGRIRLRGRVVEVDDVNGAVQLTVDLVVEIEGGARPACVAQSIWRHYAIPQPR